MTLRRMRWGYTKVGSGKYVLLLVQVSKAGVDVDFDRVTRASPRLFLAAFLVIPIRKCFRAA